MKSGWRFSEMHEMNMNIASIHTHRSMHAQLPGACLRENALDPPPHKYVNANST